VKLVYDIESYPNIFTFAGVDIDTGVVYVFECSDRINQEIEFRTFINYLRATESQSVMIGFNNQGYDYPVIHHALNSDEINADVIYWKSKQIIDTPWNDRFDNVVWDSDHIVPQIDLSKIHHFDNANRATSLKVLEFNMMSPNIKDLPYPPGTVLNNEQKDNLIKYNIADVVETWRFYLKSVDKIDFRKSLSRKYDHNFMNASDPKIGADYFIMELEKAGVACYTKQPGQRKQPIQTWRDYINLADAVLPSITFVQPEFNRILNFFKEQTIYETKGVFDDVFCEIDGFSFSFGLGGLHGSVNSQIVISDSEYIILDVDVESYYPNVAIKNRFYPEHLSEKFCDAYEDLFNQRKSHAKGTSENAMLKLALNATFGKSNSTYSPFYDPLLTMKITVNGQLLLCKLADMVLQPGISLVQANTDGITFKVRRDLIDQVKNICAEWEQMTKLKLEYNEYNRMFIRDANSYIAEYMKDGKLKRKGAYGYGPDLDWNQNYSGQVIAKAAEAALVRGESIRKFIETHTVMNDFFMLAKVNRNCQLTATDRAGNETEIQKTSRYYITRHGDVLTKIMPPLPKKPDHWRRFAIQKGWQVKVCNDVAEATAPVNYEYYIQEAQKLLL
jgi:hypothetical protein